MKISILVFSLVVSLSVCSEEHSDQMIKDNIIGAWCYIDNMEAARSSFNYARSLCGSDSNRYSRLLYEISLTNNARYAESAMRLLRLFGTPAQLPYLYSVTTDEIRGAEAARAILRLDGVTTNSILAVSNCLASVEIDIYERYKVFYDFVERVYRLTSDDQNRNFGHAYINWYVRNENMGCEGIDKLLTNIDPPYRQSKRRLADLRSAMNRGVHEFQHGYITNAINELVAYPEAELPN